MRCLAPAGVHDDIHRAPLRPILSQQQIGQGIALLRPYTGAASGAPLSAETMVTGCVSWWRCGMGSMGTVAAPSGGVGALVSDFSPKSDMIACTSPHGLRTKPYGGYE